MAEKQFDILQQKISDITECPICTEDLINPKILPCVHTFCLKCLERYGKGRKDGDFIVCPLCRKNFQIPEGGFSNLPNNFFLGNLVEVKKVTSQTVTTTLCDICSNESSAAGAQSYCGECHQNLCRQCTEYHKKVAATRAHQTILLGSKLSSEDLAKSCVSYCQQHRSEKVKIYCFDCKSAICMMCYIGKHNAHKCSDIDEVADDFRNQIQHDIEKIDSSIAVNTDLIQQLQKERINFEKQADNAESMVTERSEELRQQLEKHTKSLLGKLSGIRKERTHDIENAIDKIAEHILNLERFKEYSTEVKEKATSTDTACSAEILHSRASELEGIDALGEVLSGSFKFVFKASNLEKQFSLEKENLLGKIEKQYKVPEFEYHVTIKTGQVVCGLAVMDESLYVVRPNERHITVYDLKTLTEQRKIQPQPNPQSQNRYCLHTVVDMASCTDNHCLYVADIAYQTVHRVEANGMMSTWLVGGQPDALSVSPVSNNIFITFANSSSVHEYTADGNKVRDIGLSQHIVNPRHAMQLVNGQLVVCNYDPANGTSCVFLLAEHNLEIIREFSTEQADNVNARYKPNSREAGMDLKFGGKFAGRNPRRGAMANVGNQQMHLVGCKNGFILLTDFSNNKLVVLNPSLECIGQIIEQNYFSQPTRVCFDGNGNRVFVGNQGSGQIAVFGMKAKKKKVPTATLR